MASNPATSSMVVPLRLPLSQRRAVGTSNSAPWRSTYEVAAFIKAWTPRPTSTNFPIENPPIDDRAKMRAAVKTPPAIAHGAACDAPMPTMRMQNTAVTLAPDVMPMTSGLAKGLRSIVWNVLPATPKANPTSAPASRRGSRTSHTAYVAPSMSAPAKAAAIVPGEYTVLPIMISTQHRPSTRASRAATARAQRRRRARRLRLRSAVAMRCGSLAAAGAVRPAGAAPASPWAAYVGAHLRHLPHASASRRANGHGDEHGRSDNGGHNAHLEFSPGS